MANLMTWLTINRICNLRCKWCYQKEVAGSVKTMDFQLSKELIDLCSNLFVNSIILIGGEPTLHPNFFEIVKYIKNKGITTSIVSNSIKFADNKFVENAKLCGVKAVNTSIKGSSKEEYLKSTGCDVFHLVKKAIRNLENSEIDQLISVTISNSIITNWIQMINFINELGVKNFIFSFEKPTILLNDLTFDDRMLPGNIAEFIQDVMYPSLKQTGVNFKIELMFPQCVLRDSFVEKLENEYHAFGGCLLLRCDRRIVFDPDGFVLPCNHFIANPLGKYGDDFQNAQEFLDWKQSEGVRNFYQMTKMAPGERCARCDKWSKCGAGCRLYWLYKESDKLLPKSVQC